MRRIQKLANNRKSTLFPNPYETWLKMMTSKVDYFY